jgi:hypothetical protein
VETANWNPDDRQLRQFGWASLIAFAVLGLVFAWRLDAFAGSGRWSAPAVLWAVGVILAVAAAGRPRSVRPAYLVLMFAAAPINWVVMRVLFAVIYYLIFTPVALLFRLIGRDPLRRRSDPQAASYWVERRSDAPVARYFRQF